MIKQIIAAMIGLANCSIPALPAYAKPTPTKTTARRRNGASVAHCKRMAAKARNKARNKAAHKGKK